MSIMDTENIYSDIKELTERLEAKIDEVTIELIKWLIGVAIVQTILIVIFVKFL